MHEPFDLPDDLAPLLLAYLPQLGHVVDLSTRARTVGSARDYAQRPKVRSVGPPRAGAPSGAGRASTSLWKLGERPLTGECLRFPSARFRRR